VDLAERGGGHRHGLEVGERLGHAGAELGVHDPLDVLEGERLDLVLEAGEGGEIGRRQHVGPRGEQLAQLHERRPELLQVVSELFGFRGRRLGRR
jgi:hypothetical protein